MTAWVSGIYQPYGIFEPEEVIALRRRYPSVHRLRKSERSVEVVKCPKTKEELWVVGDMTMPYSEMMNMARSL